MTHAAASGPVNTCSHDTVFVGCSALAKCRVWVAVQLDWQNMHKAEPTPGKSLLQAQAEAAAAATSRSRSSNCASGKHEQRHEVCQLQSKAKPQLQGWNACRQSAAHRRSHLDVAQPLRQHSLCICQQEASRASDLPSQRWLAARELR